MVVLRKLCGLGVLLSASFGSTLIVLNCKQSVQLRGGPDATVTPFVQPSVGVVFTQTPSSPSPVISATAAAEKKCCTFPVPSFPDQSFTDGGVASYGSGRDGGARKHAASDLYQPVGTKIHAVDDGTILDTYFFYSDTYAVEVKHPQFIVRYGEIRANLAPGLKVGSKVKAGQWIASVGQMTCCRPMLHFEMFSGKGSGPLTNTSVPPFYRRNDLINPTSNLLQWRGQMPK
jgi:murein DD-endopeptidase MepM/ murein hydrolase activator NlpD